MTTLPTVVAVAHHDTLPVLSRRLARVERMLLELTARAVVSVPCIGYAGPGKTYASTENGTCFQVPVLKALHAELSEFVAALDAAQGGDAL